MREVRYCLDCSQVGEINQQGNCGTCGSTAVVLPEGLSAWETRKDLDLLELQKIFNLPVAQS